MAIDTTSPRTRRAILIGALGGVAASVAAAVGRASSVSATDGDIVKVGHTYSASSPTTFHATGHLVDALVGTSRSGSGVYGSSISGYGVSASSDSGTGVICGSTSGYGLYGTSTSGIGVSASSTSGNGVFASSQSGRGVSTSSDSGIGVYGSNFATGQPAILGEALDNTGLQGYSGGGAPPAAPAKTGVYGYANQDAKAVGVKGQSVLGAGGHFVAGTTGVALHAIGRVKLDNAAGVATIAAGTNSIAVTPGTDLTASSAVVATLMGSAGDTTTVQRVAVNLTTDTFTIVLTANATAAVKVAWHVFG